MHSSDYYRDQADYYRLLAGSAENDADKYELLELATACEEAADNLDDHRASG
jgi:hypothetical protein